MRKSFILFLSIFLVACGHTAPELEETVEPEEEPVLEEEIEVEVEEEGEEPEVESDEPTKDPEEYDMFTLQNAIRSSSRSLCTKEFSEEELPQVFQDYLEENEARAYSYCVYQNKAYLGVIVQPDRYEQWQILYRLNADTVVASDSYDISGYGNYTMGFGVFDQWDVYVLDELGDAVAHFWTVYALDNESFEAEVIESCGANWSDLTFEEMDAGFDPEYSCSTTQE